MRFPTMSYVRPAKTQTSLRIEENEKAFEDQEDSTAPSYYVVNRHAGKTMKDILKDFDPNWKKRNDRFLVSKMRPAQRLRRLNTLARKEGPT